MKSGLLIFALICLIQTTVGVITAPDHVVMVIFENRDLSDVTANSQVMKNLMTSGVSFLNFSGITHPSQPSYLYLFSASNQGVVNNNFPPAGAPFSAKNMASEFIAAEKTFYGYSDGLPSVGYTGASSPNGYVGRHNPWVDFSNVASSLNVPFTAFPSDFTQLPTLSIVVPNLCNSSHDCSLSFSDSFLNSFILSYQQWAMTHNSLMVITFDEANPSSPATNPIYTLLIGANLPQNLALCGNYNHFSLQRWLLELYNIPLYHTNLDNAKVLPTSLWFDSQSWSSDPDCPTTTTTTSTTSSSTTTTTSTSTSTTTSTSTSTTTKSTTTSKPTTTTSTTTKPTTTTTTSTSTSTKPTTTLTSTSTATTTSNPSQSTSSSTTTKSSSSTASTTTSKPTSTTTTTKLATSTSTTTRSSNFSASSGLFWNPFLFFAFFFLYVFRF